MDIFDVLNLVGGLSLFLFGMNIMGQALERRAGDKLKELIGKFTTNKLAGLLTGLGVTAIIQSSSATTVMVVGFVNSGLMSLSQAINVIMGANIGTTVTAWILSLSGISSTNLFVQLLKPTSFTPILALIGIINFMFVKDDKKKDTGLILLGFATLMFGMDTMSGAVAGLRDVPAFTNLFIAFKNPILGVLAGAVLTAVIQSSSASVGILQALATTGQVSYSAAIPIIMGQNIGTCVTAMLSSVGTNINARRTAMVHLMFNVIGTGICLTGFCLGRTLIEPEVLDAPVSLLAIAVIHSVFNVLCTLIMVCGTDLLEKLVIFLVPEPAASKERKVELDERLLATPAIALDRCDQVTVTMACDAVCAVEEAMELIHSYTGDAAALIRKREDETDYYEDILGSYLVKLSAQQLGREDGLHAAELLKMIGDMERIADHAVNLVNSVEELNSKGDSFTFEAREELLTMRRAIDEMSSCIITALTDKNLESARSIEPLRRVVTEIKEDIRDRHILRLQKGECSIETGFVLSDILTSLERIAGYYSNLAESVLSLGETRQWNSFRDMSSENFMEKYRVYKRKFRLAAK